MLYYSYDPVTGKFTGAAEADRDPLEEGEVYALPANATWVEPPATEGEQYAMFDGNDWVVVDPAVDISEQIRSIPYELFGGPTLKELFSGY